MTCGAPGPAPLSPEEAHERRGGGIAWLKLRLHLEFLEKRGASAAAPAVVRLQGHGYHSKLPQ